MIDPSSSPHFDCEERRQFERKETNDENEADDDLILFDSINNTFSSLPLRPLPFPNKSTADERNGRPNSLSQQEQPNEQQEDHPLDIFLQSRISRVNTSHEQPRSHQTFDKDCGVDGGDGDDGNEEKQHRLSVEEYQCQHTKQYDHDINWDVMGQMTPNRNAGFSAALQMTTRNLTPVATSSTASTNVGPSSPEAASSETTTDLLLDFDTIPPTPFVPADHSNHSGLHPLASSASPSAATTRTANRHVNNHQHPHNAHRYHRSTSMSSSPLPPLGSPSQFTTSYSDGHSTASDDDFSSIGFPGSDFRSETSSIDSGSNGSSNTGGAGAAHRIRLRRGQYHGHHVHRRPHGHHQRRHYHRHGHHRHRPSPSVPETIQEQQRTRLRQSLDAGMAALRRWIRTNRHHNTAADPNNTNSSSNNNSITNGNSAIESDDGGIAMNQLIHNNHRTTLNSATVVSPLSTTVTFPPLPPLPHRQRAWSEPQITHGMRELYFEQAASSDRSFFSYASAEERSHSSGGRTTPIESTNTNGNESTTTTTNAASATGAAAAAAIPEPTTTNTPSPPAPPADEEPEGTNQNSPEARQRWYQLNRRFQFTITIVALLFSLLLLAILICWVVFTSAYVMSIDKPCDVPLKTYYWLATIQLILDVFRTDIMRLLCRWEYNSNQRIPVRVIAYNVAYLVYAFCVLRLGVESVFVRDGDCCDTASELFESSQFFVSLTLAAWSLIIFGYLIPFVFVATLLTWNGYTPASDVERRPPAVFPAAYSTTGAPADTIHRLRTVLLEEFPSGYPKECCICMADFVSGDAIVATECSHVFHKRCCQEWLKQARTCPVCRDDIPESLAEVSEHNGTEGVGEVSESPEQPQEQYEVPPRHRRNFHTEVVSLFRIFREQEMRYTARQRRAQPSAAPQSIELAQQQQQPTEAAERSRLDGAEDGRN